PLHPQGPGPEARRRAPALVGPSVRVTTVMGVMGGKRANGYNIIQSNNMSTELINALTNNNGVRGTSDYPTPLALVDEKELVWYDDDLAVNNYVALGDRLAAAGDLYRRPGHASGLWLASNEPNIEPEVIVTGDRLGSLIGDRVRVRVVKDGNSKGSSIPAAHLKMMLRSEVFLQRFRPIDEVIRVPLYLPNFELT